MNSANTRPLPDPEISLRDARDFIIGSNLARRAFASSQPAITLFLHDLLDVVYRLVQSCHLPEFTDYGLPHLCSLVDRVSRWDISTGATASSSLLADSLEPDEATTLLIALLIHDLGMLSHNPVDLPTNATQLQSKAQWSDIANWVRHTHVSRWEKLVLRVMPRSEHEGFLKSDLFSRAIEVAKSHQQWPWEWSGAWSADPRLRGLAAVVAVTDLLDEDSARCDTTTLLEHREGNLLNRAHWLRHALTDNRVLVVGCKIEVTMVKPPNTGSILRPLYSALRNHFRLVMLYDKELNSIGAPITNIELAPSTGTPSLINPGLAEWNMISGLASHLCRGQAGPI